MLEIPYCRQRQDRLLQYMQANQIALAVFANPKSVYYLTGALVDPMLPQAFAIDDSGGSLLITDQEPRQALAGRVERYTAYTLERPFHRSTMQTELGAAASAWVGSTRRGPVALEAGWVPYALATALIPGGAEPATDITPYLIEARRRKDPDELASMRGAVRLVEAAYGAIKARLEPGMTECQAYEVVHEAMVAEAGTSVLLRGDFACGTRAIGGGGPPTRRKVQSGDLYIFDLFPTFEGYMCDLCRTFAAGRPTALQREVWGVIQEAHRLAEKRIRPGAEGREVYQALREHLERFAPLRGSFTHHAGHAVGMDGWEYPWLTPGSDQVIQAGEVIACEPGLYGEAIGGGIRLERDYLVGEDGVTPLDSFPMEL